MVIQKVESGLLIGAAGFLNPNPEPRELCQDLGPWQDCGTASQNGGFKNRVLGPVEPKEIAESALGHRFHGNRSAFLLVLQRVDPELGIAAGTRQNQAPNLQRWLRRWVKFQT